MNVYPYAGIHVRPESDQLQLQSVHKRVVGADVLTSIKTQESLQKSQNGMCVKAET